MWEQGINIGSSLSDSIRAYKRLEAPQTSLANLIGQLNLYRALATLHLSRGLGRAVRLITLLIEQNMDYTPPSAPLTAFLVCCTNDSTNHIDNTSIVVYSLS